MTTGAYGDTPLRSLHSAPRRGLPDRARHPRVDILSLFFTRRTRPGQPTRPSRTRRASSSIEQEGEEDAHAATHTDLADQRELRLVRGSGPVAPHRHFPLHAVEDGLVHDVVHDVMDDVMLDEVVVNLHDHGARHLP